MATPCPRCNRTTSAGSLCCSSCGLVTRAPILAWLLLCLLVPLAAVSFLLCLGVFLMSFEAGFGAMFLLVLPAVVTSILLRWCRALLQYCGRYPANPQQKQAFGGYVAFMIGLTAVTIGDFPVPHAILTTMALKDAHAAPDMAGWLIYGIAATVMMVLLCRQAGRTP